MKMEEGTSKLCKDDFFRQLNLQSTHLSSLKHRYYYRQALKERLRKTTSIQREPTPIHKPDNSPVKCHNVILNRYLSPNSKKRFFGLPNVPREPQTQQNNEDCNSQESILKPLYQNCHVIQHPKIQKELRGLHNNNNNNEEAKVDEHSLRNNNNNSIVKSKDNGEIIKKTYYVEPESRLKYNNQRTLKSTPYSVKYRIQATRKDCFNQTFNNPNSILTPYLLKEEMETKFKENNKFCRKKDLFCPLCCDPQFFKTVVLLQKHVSTCHSTGHHGVASSSSSNNTNNPHSSTSNNNPKHCSFRCYRCDEFFKSKTDLEIHLRSEHVDPGVYSKDFLKCDICCKDFSIRKNLIRHIKSLHCNEIHRIELSKFVSLRKQPPV